MGSIHDRFKAKELTGELAARNLKPGQSMAIVRSEPAPRVRSAHSLEDFEISNAFRKQKYIVADHPDLGEVALTFPNFLVHADMARQVFRGLEIVSAGFFTINDSQVSSRIRAYGRSESLNKDSRIADEALIARTLGID